MADIQDKQPLGLDSATALMAQGPNVLHGYVADKVEAAMGKSMPQMEVRFNNLSITAKVFASRHSDPKAQLPTLYNSVKKSVAKINAKNHTAEKVILKNASGVFKPGTITLLLGQPGSGKSSLMKVLSGRFPLEKNVTVEGDITYNGQMQKEIMKRLPQFVAYVTQRDKHFPTLTVKETLEFAHAFCGGGLSTRTEELLSKGTPLVFADCPSDPTWDSDLQQYVDVGPELGCQPLTDLPVTMDPTTVKGYVESVFKMKHDEIWSNFGYVFLFLGILRLMALLSLRYINHQKR